MEKPLKLLHASLNNRVMVELRGGRGYHGTLDGYDVPHMNLVLKNAEEMDKGQSTGKHCERRQHNLCITINEVNLNDQGNSI